MHATLDTGIIGNTKLAQFSWRRLSKERAIITGNCCQSKSYMENII